MKWKHKELVRYEEEQKRLKSLKGKRHKVFAWLPIETNKGIVVWLEYVWVDYFITETNGRYSSATTIHYSNEVGSD